MHGTHRESSVRYVIGALAFLLLALVVMVAGTGGVPVEGETVSAFGVPPQAVVAPPTATPTATPVAKPEDVEQVEPELANTEVQSPTTQATPIGDGVRDSVAAGDGTAADAAATPAAESPTATAIPQPTPTPHTHPATPTPAPTPHAHEPEATPAPTSTPTPTPHTHDATPTPDPGPTTDPQPTPDGGGQSSGAPTPAQWAALRQCESGGDYTIVSANGLYRGAYQFSVSTWDWVASGAWPELVGVDPAQASPADQDKMALRLYDTNGRQPWPVCGQHLL